MVHVGAQHDHLALHCGATTGENSDHVPRVPLLGALCEFIFAGRILYVAAIISTRFNPQLAQFRAEIDGSEQLIERRLANFAGN